MKGNRRHLIKEVVDENAFIKLKQLQEDVLGYTRKNFMQYGDTYSNSLLNQHLIITKDPEWLRHIFQTNHKNYRKGRANAQLDYILGKGLLTSEGEFWRRQRKLIQPAFYKKRLESISKVMAKTIEGYIYQWRNLKGTAILIDQQFLDLTSDIVITSLLGESIKNKLPEFPELIEEMQAYIIKLVRIPFFIHYSKISGKHKKFLKIRQKFDDVVFDIIEERMQSSESHDDLLSMLIDARYEGTETGMSKEQIRDEFITIFIAGHETTSFALSWAFYLLGNAPNVVDRLKKESHAYFKNIKDGKHNWMSLKYHLAVIKESMRIFPPAYFVSREAIEDDEIQPQKIVRKDDVILMSIIEMHRDPKVWPNAHLFDPERFMKEKISEQERHCYFPFGGGPRMCIGNNFALMEAVLVLAYFFNEFDFELVKNHIVAPEPLITLRPKNGVKVVIK